MNKNICIVCNKARIAYRKLYCVNCYSYGLRHGTIKKLEKPSIPEVFSLERKEIITGSMLGDGCIFKYKPTHKPYFCIMRKSTDDRYLIWEYEKFKYFCISEPKYRTTFDARTNKNYYSVKFMTRRIDLLEPYYNLWYPDGKKIVPTNLELSPLSLAIWFCDDGNIGAPKNSPWRMRIKLSTHGFSYNEVEFLQSMLRIRFGEKFPLVEENDNGTPHTYITGADNATRAFISEIDSVFPESMLRKAFWKNTEARYYENIPDRTSVYSSNRSYKLTNKEKIILEKMFIEDDWISATNLAIQMNIYHNSIPAHSIINWHLKKFYKLGWIKKIGKHRGKVRTQYKISEIGIKILNKNKL